MDLLEKYKPRGLDEILGNQRIVQESAIWVSNFSPGRGKMLHGPTGTGKSLIVETIAKEKKLDLLELDSSDSRSGQDIENFAQGTVTRSLFSNGKVILINDVDGISGNDRGAISGLVKLIKSSTYPVFLTANNPWLPKLFPLRAVADFVKFSKIPSPSIEKKLKDICAAEGKEISPDMIKQISRSCGGDIRSAINDLQSLFLTGDEIGFREREKSIFDILPLIFNSRNIDITRKEIFSCDKDSDEVFMWIENNLHLTFRNSHEIVQALDLLSRADVYRSRTRSQQNWRFKAYMTDLMSGVSLMKKERAGGFIPYQPPSRFRMNKARAIFDAACGKIGEQTHTSKNVVRRDYVPYIKIILKKKRKEDFGILDKEDLKAIRGG